MFLSYLGPETTADVVNLVAQHSGNWGFGFKKISAFQSSPSSSVSGRMLAHLFFICWNIKISFFSLWSRPDQTRELHTDSQHHNKWQSGHWLWRQTPPKLHAQLHHKRWGEVKHIEFTVVPSWTSQSNTCSTLLPVRGKRSEFRCWSGELQCSCWCSLWHSSAV